MLALSVLTLGPAAAGDTGDSSLAVSSLAVRTATEAYAQSPVTVTSVVRFPEAGLDAVDRVWLAGIGDRPDGPPTLLSVVWAESDDFFRRWRLSLSTEAALIPGEGARASLALETHEPKPGHVYETALSYDPGAGAVSIAVTDVTTGARVYAGEMWVRPYADAFYPGAAVRYRDGGTGKAGAEEPGDGPAAEEKKVELRQLSSQAAYVPVGFESRLVQKTERSVIPASRIDRRVESGILTRLLHDAPGRLRLTLRTQEASTLVAELPARAGEVFTALSDGAVPPGSSTLVVDYVDERGVRLTREHPIDVGVVSLGFADLSVNLREQVMEGALVLEADGELPEVGVRLTASLVYDASTEGDESKGEPVLVERDETLVDQKVTVGGRTQTASETETAHEPSETGRAIRIPFRLALPIDEAVGRIDITVRPVLRVAEGVESQVALPQEEVIQLSEQGENRRLHEAYAGDFLIGTAADSVPQDMEHLAPHFNAITAENALKWERVHPRPDRYAFAVPDALVRYAEQNGMAVIGHTLIWHNQTPAWVFQDEQGNPISRERLLERMEEHIKTVVGRYCGRIRGWDVVNEALADDGRLCESPWLEIVGEEYIEKAFRWAHEACPSAELYYNDYNLTDPRKRAGAIRLVKSLQEKGVPIHGVGEQGHWSIYSPSDEQARATITDLAALGVKVLITELDLSVYPWSERRNLYPDGLPDHLAERQAERYGELFALFREHRDVIDRVSFWGLSDKYSWKNNFPVRGRADYPLLFDREGEPKPAFWAVLDASGR